MTQPKKLLVVVDMQRDFIDGALGTAQARSIVSAVRSRVARARARGETVVFTRDTHGEEYLATQEGRRLPVPHCVRGGSGWDLLEGLAETGERCFDKPCFGSVDLARYAAEQGFAFIELIGVCTDICVISNALLLKSFCPEAEICVRADCCAGVTEQSHRNALEAMRACQIDIAEGAI